jgi:hypothetical protein
MDMHVLTRMLRERREDIELVVDLVLLMIGWSGIVATLALLIMTLLIAANAG